MMFELAVGNLLGRQRTIACGVRQQTVERMHHLLGSANPGVSFRSGGRTGAVGALCGMHDRPSYGRSKFAAFRRTFPSHPHAVLLHRKRQTAVTKTLATRSTGRRLIRRAKAPHLGQVTGARSLKVETICVCLPNHRVRDYARRQSLRDAHTAGPSRRRNRVHTGLIVPRRAQLTVLEYGSAREPAEVHGKRTRRRRRRAFRHHR